MPDIFKFPNGGYDVIVCRKQDILDSIDDNIIDKDVALAIVEQVEKDAANFINEGRWTGLPFIGNVRVNQVKAELAKEENQALLKEAKDVLSHKDYLVFKRKLNLEIGTQIKNERYYNYITSISITRNRKLYDILRWRKKDHFARLYLFSIKSLSNVGGDDLNFNEYVE